MQLRVPVIWRLDPIDLFVNMMVTYALYRSGYSRILEEAPKVFWVEE